MTVLFLKLLLNKTIKPCFGSGMRISWLLLSAIIIPQLALGQLRYDDEYPALGYSTAATSDSITALLEDIESGELVLEFNEGRGYLDSLLQALEIDSASQLLVFSATALKTRFVNAKTPRALYFNDTTYIAFIQGSRSLEIATLDPNLGPLFYVFSQNPKIEIDVERKKNLCLRCHDSYSLSGDGVPRFLLSSGLVDPDGKSVSHELNSITKTSTPINRRWGGWYVTGAHGEQEHMGNLVIDNIAMLGSLDLAANGNKLDLDEYVEVEPYIGAYSDIVALLVIEHQIEVQNAIIKANYKIRTLLDAEGHVEDEALIAFVEPLVQSLLMANEVGLTDEIVGVSGFTEYFQSLGPRDSKGRSLREFDLQTRTFKYPLSYQIYSEAFAALPVEVKAYVYRRINEVLGEQDQSAVFAHLSSTDRRAMLEILQGTKPDFVNFLNEAVN